jgi:hypothetical protein
MPTDLEVRSRFTGKRPYKWVSPRDSHGTMDYPIERFGLGGGSPGDTKASQEPPSS